MGEGCLNRKKDVGIPGAKQTGALKRGGRKRTDH